MTTNGAMEMASRRLALACGAFYGVSPQDLFQGKTRLAQNDHNYIELKDSAYFPKLPLHHRWQGTNKASGI